MDGRPPWALLAALLVVVSGVVYGLARWSPFAPSAAPAADVAGGDATAGAAVFAGSCAVCHGPQAEGGVGPRLAGAGLSAQAVAGVVAAGRGIMPAGIVSGADAADVAAYVASISGGAPAPAAGGATTTGAATAPSSPPAPRGTARLTGPALTGLRVRLAGGASADWPVRLQGPAGRIQVGILARGERGFAVGSTRGGRSILDGFDTILVGADPVAPDLRGIITPGRAADLTALLVDDPEATGPGSALDRAAGQVAVLHEHVGFLVAARDGGDLANVRFHGEHMVNITRGAPVRDVDGNGDASNPGDGVGLLGADGWLRRVGLLSGPPVSDPDRAAAVQASVIARRGLRAGTAPDVATASPSVDAISRADRRLAVAWARLRAYARASASVTLEAP